jgi:protein tyrosine/serine phosphatase
MPRAFRNPSAAATFALGGLENFGVVNEHLLRGAQPSAAGIKALKALGVTTIIDLKFPDPLSAAEKAEAEGSGILYTNMPMDSLSRPTFEQVETILAAITNAPGKVFVHCRAGKDRTGTIVACYRMNQDHWTSDQALQEANQFRMAAEVTRLREFIRDFGKPDALLNTQAGTGKESDLIQRLIEQRQQELK